MSKFARIILLAAILAIAAFDLMAEDIPNHFVHITMSDGLSSNTVISVTGDRNGCIWVGTENGLNKYDGYDIEVFTHNAGDPHSLSGNMVNKVVALPDGRIAACTTNGLSVFDFSDRTFSNFLAGQNVGAVEPAGENSLYVSTVEKCYHIDLSCSDVVEFHADEISNVHFLKKIGNHLFVGTYDAELISISIESGEILNVYKFGSASWCQDIVAAPDGNVWVAHEGLGVIKFDLSLNPLCCITQEDGLLPSNYARSLSYDWDGRLWIGTTKGLAVFDEARKASNFYTTNLYDPMTISHNSVRSLYADGNKGMWVGTYFGGLNYFNSNLADFTSIIQKWDDLSLNDNIISRICEDPDGTLWVGTNQGGVNHLSKNGDRIAIYDIPKDPDTGVASKDIKAIHIKGDKIYLGSHNSSLSCLDKHTGKIKLLKGIGKSTYEIREYGKDYLWLGTLSGLKLYDTKKDTEINTQLDGVVLALHYDETDGRLWVGYKDSTAVVKCEGLNMIREDIPDLKSLKGVRQFFKDDEGLLWIASDYGLFKWDGASITEENITGDKNGKSVVGIEEDTFSRLWLSIGNRLYCYNPKSKVVHWYIPGNVATENVYNAYSHCKAAAGDMYFGGTVGITHFVPEEITLSEMKVSPIVTKIESNNEEFFPGESIVLGHDNKSLTIIFSVPDFQSNGNNVFSYYLDGYDNDWSKPSNDRKATYTKLPKGKYTFMVRAANSDMDWCDDVCKTQITIKAAWYYSDVAKIIYALILVFLLWWAYVQLEKKNKEKREKEVNRLKMNFLLTVSHELRTQLAYILAPLPELITRTDNIWMIRQLKNIEKKAENILKMSEQLTERVDSESGIKKLNVREQVAFGLINDQFNYFDELAKRKKLQFTFECNDKERTVFIDEEIVSALVNQLLSEAFRSTDKGSVDIKLEFKPADLEFTVSFCGDLFSEDALSYAKKLAQAHHGTLSEKSVHGRMILKATIPQSADEYSPDEMDSPREWSSEELPAIFVPDAAPQIEKKGKVLVIEDNKEILEMLHILLGKHFEVLSADHKDTAMDIVLKEKIDAIILEEKMPAMDGVQFCLSLKQNFNLCGIPIMVLTSEKDVKSQVNILQCGADDVITKPFSATILSAKVRNVIRARKFMARDEMAVSEVMSVNLSANDEEFIKKINKIIMDRISDPCLSADEIASKMNVSRSTLYIKVKNLTGHSILEMIHEIRFQQAVKLLKERKYQLAEISDMTGFNNPSYFSTSFKKYFGCTPSQYLNQP